MVESFKLLKKENIKYIILLVIGFVFYLVVGWHYSLWYDEVFSITLTKFNIKDIVIINSSDVHPPLFYIVLNIIAFIFGASNIIALRLFCCLGAFCFALLGVTYVKKLFGDKIGFIYTIFALTLPGLLRYSFEIRMYSWDIFFVTAAALSAYSAFKYNKKKSWFIFVVFSIFGAYFHNYGLIAVVLINIALFLFILIKNRKALKSYLVASVAEILLYLPWLFVLLKQVTTVSKGYWISPMTGNIIWEFLFFPFRGYLDEKYGKIIAVVLLIAVVLGIINFIIEFDFKGILIGIIPIGIYLLVFTIMFVLSIIIQPIYVDRYMIPLFGLLILSLSIFISQIKLKSIRVIVCLILIIACIQNTKTYYIASHSELNNLAMNSITKLVGKDDIFIHTDPQDAGMYYQYMPNNKHYFYNSTNTYSGDYRIFEPNFEIVFNKSEIKWNGKGKIWFVSCFDSLMYKADDFVKVGEEMVFYHPYNNYYFKMFEVKLY